jgi:hypothetical protein
MLAYSSIVDPVTMRISPQRVKELGGIDLVDHVTAASPD